MELIKDDIQRKMVVQVEIESSSGLLLSRPALLNYSSLLTVCFIKRGEVIVNLVLGEVSSASHRADESFNMFFVC